MHYATVWEAVADTVPDTLAAGHGERRLTWRQLDDRAARLAAGLVERGVGPGSKVALYLYNGLEYLLAQYAVFKLRGVVVNVNYRYLGHELGYVLDNSDSEAVVYHTSLAGPLRTALPDCPGVRVLVTVDDGADAVGGSVALDELVLTSPPLPRQARPGDDLYLLYTGGTTGRPKGVMYRQDDHCGYVQGLGYQWLGLDAPTTVAEVPDAVRAAGRQGPLVSVVAPPLMHGTGSWLGVFASWGTGGAAITLTSRSFDADELWRAVEGQRATAVTIVGDAFARPMLRSLDEARRAGRPYDLSSLRLVVSSGAMWSAEVQQGLLTHADVLLIDSMGSTEAGMGTRRTTRAVTPPTGLFERRPSVKVLDADGEEVPPGSGRAGRVASPARAIGYYKDPAKTAATFTEIDGRRYVFPGDWATVEPDGAIRLLGRGSQCINTGGEKVFPEEVEEAMSRHPDVEDSIVLGVPDDRFGEQVVAVVSPTPGGRPTGPPSRRGSGAGWPATRCPGGWSWWSGCSVSPTARPTTRGPAPPCWAPTPAGPPGQRAPARPAGMARVRAEAGIIGGDEGTRGRGRRAGGAVHDRCRPRRPRRPPRAAGPDPAGRGAARVGRGTTAPTAPIWPSWSPTGGTASTGAPSSSGSMLLPSLMADVDGVRIHVAHQPGVGPRPLPIVLVHGWPSGYLEMTRLIPLLSDPGAYGGDPADAFDVVVPSLPGYGFSGPQARGIGYARAADAIHRLMTEGVRLRPLRPARHRGGRLRQRAPHLRPPRGGRRLPHPRSGADADTVVRPAGAAADRRRAGVPRVRSAGGRRRRGRTPSCTAPSPRASATPSPTHRPAWPRGWSRSTAPGVTATATSSGATPRTSCSPAARSTGRRPPSPRRSAPITSGSTPTRRSPRAGASRCRPGWPCHGRCPTSRPAGPPGRR